MEIIKNSIMEAWKATLKALLEAQEMEEQGGKKTREIMNLVITVRNAEEITRPIEVHKSIKKWSYPELDEIEEVFFREESSPIHNYTYGARMFNFENKMNQLKDYVIPLLRKDPKSRRAIITLFDPIQDSFIGKEATPGIISIHFRIIEGKLWISALIRSNEMFTGWPANMYQISLLQKRTCEELGAEPGPMTTISHSAHLREEHYEEAREVLKKIS
ncbi:hypothetical protein JW711_05480 [Candidatus Woesearchaeota archaeon]|nr:hypothetical protein [Candidatus Woesearchaeota archaeon]